MNYDDIIEQAARVLARMEPGEDWPTNEFLGGGMTGTRDEEFRQEMIDQARDLDSAGLLARPLPTRREIADVLYGALEEGGWVSTTGFYPHEVAEAVLELLKGQEA